MQQRLLTLFVFLILIYGCGTTKSALDIANSGSDQIPNNFNPSKGIMLIEQSVNDDSTSVALSTSLKYNTAAFINGHIKEKKKTMIEYADKYYQYKYEFVAQDDIYGTTSKYNDKNIYQYALITALGKPDQYTETNSSNGQMKSTYNQPVFKFYIYDRLNNKTYAALGHGSSIILWAFKAAIKKISGNK